MDQSRIGKAIGKAMGKAMGKMSLDDENKTSAHSNIKEKPTSELGTEMPGTKSSAHSNIKEKPTFELGTEMPGSMFITADRLHDIREALRVAKENSLVKKAWDYNNHRAKQALTADLAQFSPYGNFLLHTNVVIAYPILIFLYSMYLSWRRC
jgi:hypothetical protein